MGREERSVDFLKQFDFYVLWKCYWRDRTRMIVSSLFEFEFCFESTNIPTETTNRHFMDSEMTLHSFHFLHPCIPLLSSYPTPLTKGANDTTHPISCQQPQRFTLKHTPYSISIHRKSTMRTETREKNRGFLRMCGEIRIRDCFHHNRISSAAWRPRSALSTLRSVESGDWDA